MKHLTWISALMAACACSLAAAAPFTNGDAHLIRLQYRSLFLDMVGQQCGERFPAEAEQFRHTVDAWKTAHQPALEKGARLTRSLTSPEERSRVQELGTAEFRGLEAMAEQTHDHDGDESARACKTVLGKVTVQP